MQTLLVFQCYIGCQHLVSANSTCNERCSAVTAQQSCLQGCRAIVDTFLHILQDLLNHVTVTIEAENKEGILTVWRLEDVYQMVISEISATDIQWAVQSRSAKSHSPFSTVLIPDKAFKEDTMVSKFIVPTAFAAEIEVRLCAFWRNSMVVSRTLRQKIKGEGSSPQPPKIVAQQQISMNTYVVCWSTPVPRMYKVSLSLLDGNEIYSENTPYSCFLFKNIPSENCCRASIGYANMNSSVETVVKIELIANTDVTPTVSPRLVFTNGTHLMELHDVNDYIVKDPPQQISFPVSSKVSITALCSMSRERLYVGLSDGSIYWIKIGIEEQPNLLRQPDDNPVLHMDVDHMQEKLYVVLKKKGILRCDLTNCDNYTMLPGDPLNYIEYLSLDAFNGYMYCITHSGDVFIAPLFPYNASKVNAVPITEKLTSVGSAYALEVDYDNMQLIIVEKNGSIFGMNLVNRSLSDLRSMYEIHGQYSEVKKAHFANNRMFWTIPSCGVLPLLDCLYSEEWAGDKKNIHLNQYLFAGRVVDFTFMKDRSLPLALLPPDAIGLMTSSDSALITWRPPSLLSYQAKEVEWRNIYYQYGLMSESEEQENAKLINSTGTSQLLPASPGLQYHASVRACICSVCSPLSSAINSAFAPYSELPFVMINRTDDVINVFSFLGTPLKNYFIYAPLPKDLSVPFALDPTSESLYSVENSENSIYRTGKDGIKTLFLETVNIRFMTVLSKYAVFVLASDYLILSYRLTATFELVLYSCDNMTDCGTVVGLAGDDDTGDVFFLIQNSNGTVSLFGSNQDVRAPYFISSSSDFPPIRQLLVAKEKLAFVTESGEVGVCDKKLGSLNLNLVADGVSLVQQANVTATHNISFSSNLSLTGTREKLSWAINSRFLKEKLLFKISIFKDHWGGEKVVDYSLSSQYLLSSSILELWSSRQKYDVKVEAISAWTAISLNETGFLTPTKPPTAPTNLRIFATQQKTVDGARALIDLFWEEPSVWNAEKSGYVVNCTVDGGDRWSAEVLPDTRTYSFNVKSGSVNCVVGARTEPTLITFSEPVSIDSSELRPLVRIFAVDSSNKVIQMFNSSLSSFALVKRQASTSTIAQQAIAYIGNDLFALRKDADTAQPYLLRLDSNNVDYVVQKVSLAGNVAEVDAIISDWVANRLLFISGGNLLQLFLDLLENSSASVFTPRPVMNLSLSVGDAKQLLYNPFNNTAYLLTKNGSLFALFLNKHVEENLALRFECLKTETVTAMVGNFVWNRVALDSIVVLTWNGLSRLNLVTSLCESIDIDDSIFGEKKLKAVLSFGVFGTKYIFTTSTGVVEYDESTKIAKPIEVAGVPLKQILIATQSSQPYPDRSCFAYPENSALKFVVGNELKTGAVVTITESPSPIACTSVSLPPTQFEIHFKRKDSDKVTSVLTIRPVTHIENGLLDKETDYDVSISFRNRYTSVISPDIEMSFITGYGYPTAPLDATGVAVSPDAALLFWKIPAKTNAEVTEIRYRISHMSELLNLPAAIGALQYDESKDGSYVDSLTDVVSCFANPCSAKLLHLRPSTDYKFWVRAIHLGHLDSQYEDPEAVSGEILIRTKDTPGTVRPDNITSTSIALHWISLEPEEPPIKISIEYRVADDKSTLNALKNLSSTKWKSPIDASFEWSHPATIVIERLRSATVYEYRYAADYKQTFIYADRESALFGKYYHTTQQIKTKPGTPSAPASLQLVYDDDELVVKWTPPLSNGGSDIISYALEYRPNEDADWEIAERGLGFNDSEWRPPLSHTFTHDVEFRVRAANSEGFGDYAYSRQQQVDDSSGFPVSLWAIALGVLTASLLAGCVLVALLVYYRKHEKRQKKMRSLKVNLRTIDAADSSIELPSQLANDLKSIPRVLKSFINVKNALGTGSFGEVYEGVVCGLPHAPEKSVLVAIKTLRSNCSKLDRMKFLQEAVIMNNFDHPNLVRLLGVSIESEPYYLIMELLEAGDLLCFLQSSRPTDVLPSQLSLSELIAMMVDVGRGAAYLEANRYVHRDLAARNCLITSRLSPRTTKIADFGLARTLHKGEYCRINGEELLPLRWLAPEIISGGSDSTFTTKSDVWSFGVLLWEIITLGQQPYSNKNQFEVKSLIKDGVTLEKPSACPDEIFALIKKTWIYNPNERPSFADLLPELENLQESSHYLNDKPYPPSTITFSVVSNFESSVDSNTSYYGIADRSGSSRFDKSDNHSVKKQGRPSVLRSLRKEPPKLMSLEETLTKDVAEPRNQNTLSNETVTTSLNGSVVAGSYENEGFLASYENTPDRGNPLSQHFPRDFFKNSQLSGSFANSISSVDTQSFNDSNSSYFRTARVSRV